MKNIKDLYPEVQLLLTAQPGFGSWSYTFKLFVRTLIAIIKAYGITMLLPDPNLKVCTRTYRPPDLITSAFFAGLSRLLLDELRGRKLQLTTDDTLAWGFGMSQSDKVARTIVKNRDLDQFMFQDKLTPIEYQGC